MISPNHEYFYGFRTDLALNAVVWNCYPYLGVLMGCFMGFFVKYVYFRCTHVALAYCFVLTMERLFSPCTGLHDILERYGLLGRPERLQEVNLDVSTEELVSTERAFTYTRTCTGDFMGF
jgi:hypothetical protein